MAVSIEHPTNRPNFTVVTIGELTLWYSYQTVIAWQDWSEDPYNGRHVSENAWSNTTGRHLTEIDGGNVEARKRRESRDLFVSGLNDCLKRHGLA